MPTEQSQNVGTILVEQGKITMQQHEELQKMALKRNVSFSDVVRSSGMVTEKDLVKANAQVEGLQYAELFGVNIGREVLEVIPEKLARNYQMIAFEIDRQRGVLKVAMIDPRDLKAREALSYIAREMGLKVEHYITLREALDEVFKQYESLKEEVGKALESAKERFSKDDQVEESPKVKKSTETEVQEVIKHAPVAKMVSVIMRHAVDGKASDIHIEPMDRETRIRYRVDGSLRTSLTLPLYIHDALIARVKVMANLKIDETRIPQDGRIRLELADRDVEFRVSSLPLHGREKIVMRVLDTGGKAPQLKDLGYRGRNLEVFQRNIVKPNGLVLITGPTGSGKSMTLFSALSIINSEDINISTLEDPVEYRMPGINQSQIRPHVQFTFATGLRALLRQDPDVVMVGEIRDFETAELAVHAALTGHLVFSTVHTNSAIDSIPRLIDMKVEPYLLATTLNALVAQRLVRTICNDCKELVDIDEGLKDEVVNEIRKVPVEALKGYGGVNLDKPSFYHGSGCDRCGHSGFKGRTAICEVVENTRSLRKVIHAGMKIDEIDSVLKEQKVITMKQDGLVKTLFGITTPEQVLAVTREDV